MQAPSFWWRKVGIEAALLAPLSWAYGSVAQRRMTRPGERAQVPVICIGNPTVGGAGKTPTALAIADMLTQHGHRPAILTRGYGGRLAGPVRVDATVHDAGDVGDEALLLARRFPTVVSHDRAAGAREAHGQGATVIVMDDGFQNPSLLKDLSFLVVDGTRGVGNGKVVPAGPLRAPLPSQLAAAQALLVVGDRSARSDAVATRAEAAGLSVFRAALRPDETVVAQLAGKRFLAFAGIGDPEKFFRTLAAVGIEAPVRRSFPDHHRYTADEARRLLDDAARETLTLLTTEKDAARLTTHGPVGELARHARTLPVTLAFAAPDDVARYVTERIAARSAP